MQLDDQVFLESLRMLQSTRADGFEAGACMLLLSFYCCNDLMGALGCVELMVHGMAW